MRLKMTISTALQAFCSMFEQVVETKKTAIEHQSETTVNKTHKSSSRAIKAANKALDIADNYTVAMDKKDANAFRKYKKVFDNNIGSK